jgi:DNA-binding PadR family transcriptional regulator
MPRWDILQRDTRRDLELPPPQGQEQQQQSGGSMSIGRGSSDNAASNQPEKPQERPPDRPQVPRADRSRDRERRSSYALRQREIRAMTDIGTFRTVDAQDLARFAYGGDTRAMNYDLGELRTHGLVEEKVVTRAHRQPRKVVALTEKGHRLLRQASGLNQEQRLYHGFVKQREIEHDADLYKVYQQAAAKIRAQGGKPVRVRLDFELKAAIQRERNAMKELPEDERANRLRSFAAGHNLTIVSERVHVPDVQIEYETREGQLERTNLELVSENYRTEGIRSKAESGFALYARNGDSSRIRRALQDTRTVERILSL